MKAGSSSVRWPVLREKVCVGWFGDGRNIERGSWLFERALAGFKGKGLRGFFEKMFGWIVLRNGV